MRIAELKLYGEEPKEQITGFLKRKYKDAYFLHREDISIIITEEYSMSTSSSFTITLIIFFPHADKNDLHVHIMGSGSGSGFFNFDWWKTRRKITNIYRELEMFCRNNNIRISDLQIRKKILV